MLGIFSSQIGQMHTYLQVSDPLASTAEKRYEKRTPRMKEGHADTAWCRFRATRSGRNLLWTSVVYVL